MKIHEDLVSYIIEFCRALRDQGLLIGPAETSYSLQALALVDVLDRIQVYWALRTVLVSRFDEIPAFDACFRLYWSFKSTEDQRAGGPRSPRRKGTLRISNRSLQPLGLGRPIDDAKPSVQIIRTGASAAVRHSARDLGVLEGGDLPEILKIAARIARALPSRPGRRLRKHRRKGVPDLRGAFRENLNYGVDLITLPRRKKMPRAPRLLVLLDVSGSMDRYAQLLLKVMYALGQRSRRVETFVFSTSLTKVTRQMRLPRFQDALQQVGEAVRHWSGGTRIGESLRSINVEFPDLLDRNTSVILLSDGWDTGSPAHLAEELSRLRKRVRRIIWLNPLLGTPDYQPLTMGLQAARPYVDLFASARNLEQIKRLPGYLRSQSPVAG